MGVSALQQGAAVNLDKKCFILLRKITDDLWQLEDVKTKRVHEYTDDQLRSFYISGQLTFVNPKVINCKLNNDQNYLDIAPEQ